MLDVACNNEYNGNWFENIIYMAPKLQTNIFIYSYIFTMKGFLFFIILKVYFLIIYCEDPHSVSL